MGEDVGALQGLGPEAEDVVDDEEGFFGGWGAGCVCRGVSTDRKMMIEECADVQVFRPLTVSYLPFCE